MIEALCQRPMNLEVRGRTVALDHGTLTRGSRVMSVVGLPGQRRFAPVRESLAPGASAAVWVQRASLPADAPTAAFLAHLGVPYLVYRNSFRGEFDLAWRLADDLGPPVAVISGDLGSGETRGLVELDEHLWRLLRLSGSP